MGTVLALVSLQYPVAHFLAQGCINTASAAAPPPEYLTCVPIIAGWTMSRLRDALPFHVFTRRSAALQLYKDMNRAVRRISDKDLRRDLCAEIRHGFRKNQHLTDAMASKSLMQEGRRQLKQLESMADVPPNSSMGGYTNRGDEDSWINQKDGDHDDDERGRVGKGWPWAS